MMNNTEKTGFTLGWKNIRPEPTQNIDKEPWKPKKWKYGDPISERESGYFPTAAYARHIGKKPWLEAGVLGTTAAVVGYTGMSFAVPMLFNLLMTWKSDSEKSKMIEEYENDGTLQFLKRVGALAGVAVGLGYAASKHMDVGSGLKGAWDSMKDSEYWNKPRGKARLEEITTAQFNKNVRKRIRRSRRYNSGLGQSQFEKEEHDNRQKIGALGGWKDPLFNSERIPVSYSLDLINADPFLSLSEKDITGMVLEGAEGSNSGLVSGRDIARSAVHAGVGAAAGLLLGKTLGALLSLPSPVTRRLSMAGAIAGALSNTGLFSEIKR